MNNGVFVSITFHINTIWGIYFSVKLRKIIANIIYKLNIKIIKNMFFKFYSNCFKIYLFKVLAVCVLVVTILLLD